MLTHSRLGKELQNDNNSRDKATCQSLHNHHGDISPVDAISVKKAATVQNNNNEKPENISSNYINYLTKKLGQQLGVDEATITSNPTMTPKLTPSPTLPNHNFLPHIFSQITTNQNISSLNPSNNTLETCKTCNIKSLKISNTLSTKVGHITSTSFHK